MAELADRPIWGSKGAVNRAGIALRDRALIDEHVITLEKWRMAHRSLIHAFEGTLRARAKEKRIEVAQRLKRRFTIADKLRRYPKMELARMDDIAGCRLIFQSIDELYEFRDAFHQAKFSHVRRNEKNRYDYIKAPTNRGYRGVHDVYEYCAKKGRATTCNGFLIEIQYRTQIQHAWATAVEVVTQITEHQPKFDRGDQRYVRFFCVASEILAREYESRKGYLSDLSDRELAQEFSKINEETHVLAGLIHLEIHRWIDDKAKSKHVILHTNKDGKLMHYPYDTELEAASALLEMEKRLPDDDIVLVGAQTVAEVTSAFRNYFADVREFLRLISYKNFDLN